MSVSVARLCGDGAVVGRLHHARRQPSLATLSASAPYGKGGSGGKGGAAGQPGDGGSGGKHSTNGQRGTGTTNGAAGQKGSDGTQAGAPGNFSS